MSRSRLKLLIDVDWNLLVILAIGLASILLSNCQETPVREPVLSCQNAANNNWNLFYGLESSPNVFLQTKSKLVKRSLFAINVRRRYVYFKIKCKNRIIMPLERYFYHLYHDNCSIILISFIQSFKRRIPRHPPPPELPEVNPFLKHFDGRGLQFQKRVSYQIY